MVAKPTTAKNEGKMIGLVDQGVNSPGSGNPVDRDARTGWIALEQIDPLKPAPLVIGDTIRTNKELLRVQRFADHFRWRQGKLNDRILLQLQAAQIRPGPWY